MRCNTTTKATELRCGKNIRPSSDCAGRPACEMRASMNSEKPIKSAGQAANILVVDDTPANLQVLAGMLKDRGYKVRPVPSGKLALQAAERDPPDLILLDINMPVMNGYEVCEHLKADAILKGIPII